jgi:thiol:disulfide interchange protein
MNRPITNDVVPRTKAIRRASLGALFTAIVLGFALAGCSPSGSRSENGSEAQAKIAWLTDYDAALKQARSEGKLVLIDFFAAWCGPCQLMERTTFVDDEVKRSLTGFVPLKIDVDRQPQVAARYGVEGLPTTLVVDAHGKPVAQAVGYLDAKEYVKTLGDLRAAQSKLKRDVLGQ